MRVLFVSSELPYPADSGATIKTASIVEYLSRRHDVHVLCFQRRAQTREQARWGAEVGGPICYRCGNRVSGTGYRCDQWSRDSYPGRCTYQSG